MKKLFFWLLIMTTGIAGGLGVVETVLGALHFKTPPTIWNYQQGAQPNQARYRPDIETIFSLDTKSPLLTGNGYRKNETENDSAAGSCSILAVGDSFTWGEGVGNQDTYPSYLERFIKDSPHPCAVHNAGVPGFSLDQKLVITQKFMAKGNRPNTILVEVNENDLFDGLNLSLFTVRENKLVRIPAWIHGYFLSGMMYSVFPKRMYELRIVQLVSSVVQKIRFSRMYRPKGDAKYAWVKQKIALEIVAWETLAKKYGARVLFVLAPQQGFFVGLPDLDEYQFFQSLFGNKQNALDANVAIRSFIGVKQQKDLAELLFFSSDKEPNTSLVYGWRHLNAIGNQAFAKVIADWIKTMDK